MKIPTLWGKQLQELSKIIFIYQNVRRIDPNLRHPTKFCVKENVIKPLFADPHAKQIANIFWQSGVGMSGPNAWLWAWRLSQPIQGGWGRDDFFQRNHVTTCTWTTETCVTLTKFDVHIELEIQIRSVGTSNWNLNRLPSVCCIKATLCWPSHTTSCKRLLTKWGWHVRPKRLYIFWSTWPATFRYSQKTSLAQPQWLENKTWGIVSNVWFRWYSRHPGIPGKFILKAEASFQNR